MLKWLKRVISTILIVFFLIVGVLFAIRNPQLMSLDFVFWKAPELSVALYIIASFILGVFAALLVSTVTYLKQDRKLKVLNRRYDKVRDEVDALRKASISKELSVGKE